jgi:hypothetical protein
MTPVLWQFGWTIVFGWLTYSVAQSVLGGRRVQLPDTRMQKFHHRVMQPFGAILAFVCAGLTVGAGYSLIEMLLSQ